MRSGRFLITLLVFLGGPLARAAADGSVTGELTYSQDIAQEKAPAAASDQAHPPQLSGTVGTCLARLLPVLASWFGARTGLDK